MSEIKVKCASMTSIGRHDEDFRSLLADAARAVLDPCTASPVRAIYLSSFAPRELCGIGDVAALARQTILDAAPWLDAPVVGPFKTGGEALFHALEQPVDGDVLVIGCEKMMHLDAGTASGLLAPRVSDPVEQRHGATLPALAALAARAYVSAFRVPMHAFDDVSVKNHENGARNPLAHFRRPVTAEEVRRSPLVSDPLRRYHCAPMSDGAAACLLSRDGGDVRITGWGRGLDAPRFHERARLGELYAATAASHRAFTMSGRSPADIDVVEIHDAFAPLELMNLEAMRFFEAGTAWRALSRGQLSVGGTVAVNPSGGMKARGHPIGVCGLTSVAEIHAQLTGAAGSRQQPHARAAVIQSAGGVSRDCYAFVLEAL